MQINLVKSFHIFCMQGLDVYLQSFTLNKDLFDDDDKIRVSITTIPGENKQSFTIDSKKMNYAHIIFAVNITKKTKKIIFVFRKKNFVKNDPIVASTVIFSNEFPKSKKDTIGTEMKTFNLYEPISDIKKLNSPYPYDHRRVFGEMQVQFKLTEIFHESSENKKVNTNNENLSNIVIFA